MTSIYITRKKQQNKDKLCEFKDSYIFFKNLYCSCGENLIYYEMNHGNSDFFYAISQLKICEDCGDFKCTNCNTSNDVCKSCLNSYLTNCEKCNWRYNRFTQQHICTKCF